MKRMPPRIAGAAAVAALTGLLAACGSGSPAPATGLSARSPGSGGAPRGSSGVSPGSGQTPGSDGQGTAVDACKLLTAAEVKQVTGETIGPFKPDLPGMKNVCIALSSSGMEVNVSVHPSSPQTFGIAKPSGTQAISGLGDRAYCQIGSLVWVLRGSEELGVSARTCAQAAALARIALTRL
jgi:hypothetical protein